MHCNVLRYGTVRRGTVRTPAHALPTHAAVGVQGQLPQQHSQQKSL